MQPGGDAPPSQKKGFQSARRNASSLAIGDALPSQATEYWLTEYDSEFFSKLGMDVEQYVPSEPHWPSTPRSFKKGFVHIQDFKTLGDKFNALQEEAQELHGRWEEACATLQRWRSDEAGLLEAFNREHSQLSRTEQQLMGTVQNMKQLMATADGNRGLMGELSAEHGIQAMAPSLELGAGPDDDGARGMRGADAAAGSSSMEGRLHAQSLPPSRRAVHVHEGQRPDREEKGKGRPEVHAALVKQLQQMEREMAELKQMLSGVVRWMPGQPPVSSQMLPSYLGYLSYLSHLRDRANKAHAAQRLERNRHLTRSSNVQEPWKPWL